MGGRDKLVQWQDKFHDLMAKEILHLKRGQSATVTKRKHVPSWIYKHAHQLTVEMKQIRKEIKNIGTLNAGSRKNPEIADRLLSLDQCFQGEAAAL